MLTKDVLCIAEDLVVVLDRLWSTVLSVRHPESNLHVDDGRRTAIQTSTVDRSVSLVSLTGSFTFEPDQHDFTF